VRVDNDLAQLLDETAELYGRSRAQVVCAALWIFAKMKPEERKAALVDYLMRGSATIEKPPSGRLPKGKK